MADDDLIPVQLLLDDNDEYHISPVDDRQLQGIMDNRARVAQFYTAGALPTGPQVFMAPKDLVEHYNRVCEEMTEVQALILEQRRTAPTMRMVELARKQGFTSNV
jgi:hypothetical protein